jgi:hypothetical protein
MKIEIPKIVYKHFEKVKSEFNPVSGNNYDSEVDAPVMGHLWWTKPQGVLWLYATDGEEGYDGSQSQFGVKKNGIVVWAFFSHCSCFGYNDYDGEISAFNARTTLKSYECDEVDTDFINIMKNRLELIAKIYGEKEVER